MKKIIVSIIICIITFGIIILNINSKENKKEKENNESISIILETEEGNIESDTFPSKEDYEYSSLVCENTSDEVNATFNEETWKLNLSVEEEEIDGVFNCQIHFKENTPPNPPVLDGDMVPVYYDEEDAVWKKADETNVSSEHKWYDYNNKMWANSITYDHTKILDLSSKNNDTSPTGSEYTSEGMYFDGVDDYIVAGYENYEFGSSITLIVRFKLKEKQDNNHSIMTNVESAGMGIYINRNNILSMNFYSETEQNYKYINLTAASNDEWYTVVGTYDGNELKMFVNGVLEKSIILNDEIKPSSQPYFLGANPNAEQEHNNFLKGTISDAIVINDVLSASEIKENYSGEVNYKENDKTLFAYDLQGYEGRNNGEVIPMEAISTMQVWIPRYKYKVWNYNSDGTKTSEPKEIDIRFERGTESTGEITCTDNIQGENGDGTSEVCELNNETCTDNLCNGSYYSHPAFTFGSEQLTGFWVGKFELSNERTYPTVLPNLTGTYNPKASIISNAIMEMKNNSVYGFSNNVDTHMIKNIEWGSIAYLSHSRYGTCDDGICVEVGRNNNTNNITGCGSEPGSVSSATCNVYNTTLGKRASTTGNIYGIYDMSGGTSEYTMGNIVAPDGVTMMSGNRATSNSGYSGVVYDEGAYNSYIGDYSYPEDKYYDKYSFGTSLGKSRGKLGDATKETYIGSTSWYNGNSGFSHYIYPWIGRGGSNNYTNSGLFFLTNGTGHSSSSLSSHLIIVP